MTQHSNCLMAPHTLMANLTVIAEMLGNAPALRKAIAAEERGFWAIASDWDEEICPDLPENALINGWTVAKSLIFFKNHSGE